MALILLYSERHSPAPQAIARGIDEGETRDGQLDARFYRI